MLMVDKFYLKILTHFLEISNFSDDKKMQFIRAHSILTLCGMAVEYSKTYRYFFQAIGREPQSTNAFKKALDKLTGVYQSRTSSGMQWQGIKPVMQF